MARTEWQWWRTARCRLFFQSDADADADDGSEAAGVAREQLLEFAQHAYSNSRVRSHK